MIKGISEFVKIFPENLFLNIGVSRLFKDFFPKSFFGHIGGLLV